MWFNTKWLGRSFAYWANLQEVMNAHMIGTPGEPEERLSTSPGVFFSTEMMIRIRKILVHSISDVRECPNCHNHFVPNDMASDNVRTLYHTLFPYVNNTPLTDGFQEWNW